MSNNKRTRISRKSKVVVVARKGPNNKKKSNEIGLLGRALRNLGALGGGAVGGLFGAPTAGASTGHGLGAAVSKWLGAGDYEVAKNSIVQRASNNIPMMHKTNQSVIIRHREFIAPINGSTNFAVQGAYTLNPGLPATFPWLAPIAARFQEYEFKGVVFHYVPTSGTFNGSTAALGSVMMQTTYRATDTSPVDKAEMMNEYWACEVVPYDTMAHPIECDPKENPFAVHYVRTAGIASGEPLMYDMAKTFIATQGMADNAVVGDLWVTYEVELKKPLVASPVIASPDYGAYWFAGGTSSSFFAGTPATRQGGLDLGVVFTTGKIITFPPGSGTYTIVVSLQGTNLTHATSLSWAGLTYVNCAAWAFDGFNSTVGTTITGTNPTASRLVISQGFRNLDPALPCSLEFPNATIASGSVTGVSVTITRSVL